MISIPLKITTLGELVLNTYVTTIKEVGSLLEMFLVEINYEVIITAEVKYKRGGSPEETITYEQWGTDTQAVARTLMNSIPKRGKKVLSVEITIERHYRDVKT